MWNTPVTFTPGQVLAASDLENNFANVSFLYGFMPFHCEGRLTLTSGTPVTTTDVTAATTLYFTPYNGSRISLYDGSSAWTLNSFSETSLSLSGLIKGVMYDIFGYLSGGTFTLEAVAWKKVTATNSPTSGSSKTINISDTSTLVVGMEVSVKDGSNSEVATITAVVLNTSITVASLTNSYTLPDVYGFQTRATALTTQNGVEVKSGSTTKRFLGTIRITTTTGQTEDSTSRRFVCNRYNEVSKKIFAYDTTNTWTANTGSWAPPNSNVTYGQGRCGVVSAVEGRAVKLGAKGVFLKAGSSIEGGVAIGVNNTTTPSNPLFGSGGNPYLSDFTSYDDFLPAGYYYFQRLEQLSAASVNAFGDNNSTYIQSGLTGSVMV